MLKPPHERYHHLYTYHLTAGELPPIMDEDFIGLYEEGDTAVLFFHRDKSALIRELCNQSGAELIYQADLPYRDWEAGHEITPFTCRGMTVSPAWDDHPADIFMDPSVVFGSGFHPTTRICLDVLLETLAVQPAGKIRTILDLGCGTGLLGIAAAKKGVARITAVDYNPLACQVAQANAARNKVSAALQVMQADLRSTCPDTAVDVVIANLHPELLTSLFERTDFWQAKTYILSGFFASQEESLLSALASHKVRMVRRENADRWRLWLLEQR